MSRQFDNPNAAVGYGPSGFVEEPFPGRGGIDWAQQAYRGVEHSSPGGGTAPTAGGGFGSPYGYDFGSGFLACHWARLRDAQRKAGQGRRRF